MQNPTDKTPSTTRLHFVLTMTSLAFPEQYDVTLDGRQVGYLRLRHGHFWAYYLDADGARVYEAELSKDFSHGIFSTEERDAQLPLALDAIVDTLMKDEPPDVECPAFDYAIDDDDVREDFNYEREPLTVLEKIQQFSQRIRNRFVDFNDVDLNDVRINGIDPNDVNLSEIESDSNNKDSR